MDETVSGFVAHDTEEVVRWRSTSRTPEGLNCCTISSDISSNFFLAVSGSTPLEASFFLLSSIIFFFKFCFFFNFFIIFVLFFSFFCWLDVKKRGKSGRSIGNATRKCNINRTSHGETRS